MAGSGWAIQPQINRNHTAVFETDKVADGEPMRLTVRMDQKWGKGSYLLGRFRLSFTNDSGTLNATKFRLELKDNELADLSIALGTAYAGKGLNDEAVDVFAQALEAIEDRGIRANILTAAASVQSILEKLADGGTAQAALARYYGQSGNTELEQAARSKAQKLLEQELAADLRDPSVAEDLAELLLHGAQVKWTVLKPTEMQSAGGATLTLNPDGSILASGQNPDQDGYTLVCRTDLARMTAVRLEALADSTLPSDGPGRSPGNGNFHLSEIGVVSHGTRISLKDIHFTFAEKTFPSREIIDGKTDSSHWGIWPKMGTTQSALIRTDFEPSKQETFEFELTFSSTYKQHSLGRFRLSVSDDAEAFEREKQIIEAKKLPDPWQRLAAAYRLVGDQKALEQLLQRHPEAEERKQN